jgi:sulfopyruvate decarboxylase TPP-binding subunit
MKKALIVLTLALSALLTLAGLAAYYWTYSEGYRVGTVIKFSHKGYVFKTWEGQIDLGFIAPSVETGTGPIATRLWDFSVHDKDVEVRKMLDKAISQNRRVKLHYHEKLWHVSIWGDTKYFVTKAEVTE